MKRTLALYILLISFGVGAKAQSAAQKATTCTPCHGPNGISANDLWPNLAGQKKSYLIQQLKAFRSGQRKDPIMGPEAKMLSDKDIEDLSTYFANLKGAQ